MTIMAVVSLNVGRVGRLGQRRDRVVHSAIRKTPVFGGGWAYVTPTGIHGDQQADERVLASGQRIHGGPLKAVYTYPFMHYWKWQIERGGQLLTPGAFGENLTVVGGLLEADVHVGDTWAWGECILEVTGPRRPCYKLDMHLGEGTARAMMQNGRCGWYSSVVKAGRAPTLGPMRLIGRRPDSPSILQVFQEKIRRDPTVPDMP